MSAINAENYSQYRKQLEELGANLSRCAQTVTSQVSEIGMKIAKLNTPVGRYDKNVSFVTTDGKVVNFQTHSKKVGGTLRRGWKKDATHKEGTDWVSSFSNNTSYAMYVNAGHRIVSDGITWGYVKGVRMMEQGMNEAQKQTSRIFENEITKVKANTGF